MKAPTAADAPILEVHDLKTHFPGSGGGFGRRTGNVVQAVDGVSFSIRKGRTLGLVGESGSGKSTTGRTIMRLVDSTAGTVLVDGTDITRLSGRSLRRVRKRMQIVLQDPFASLDPRMRIDAIISEPLRYNTALDRAARRARVGEALEMVGLDPDQRTRYPHEFSGGQRQRIGIARALILGPDLLILDEPVSALDVSIQAQIVNLLQDLQEELGLAYLLIAHDLSIVRQICDDVAVMYLGKIVEYGPRDAVYDAPEHPYTKALLSAVPISNPRLRGSRPRIVLEGDMPSPSNRPDGCAFRSRCPVAEDICATEEPPLERRTSADRASACHLVTTRPDPNLSPTPNRVQP
ncbi:oligopeptide/dipeptide ABC transporter ATP-binding protein [Euzebya pacifica]|uniref:ABC transporter ATP-binding protein n=1 Tax=Euzebya pacifica TaxID=1608957 RepID=UPI0030FC8479